MAGGLDELAIAIVRENGAAVVVGGADLGKSTLARSLAGMAAQAGAKVGFIDLDPGNNWIGPPATLSLSILPSGTVVDLAKGPAPHAMRFLGATTPERRLNAAVSSAQRLYEIARAEKCDVVVADTSSFIAGRAAAEMHAKEVKSFRATHVIMIEKEGELADLHEALKADRHATVLQTAPMHDVKPLAPEERRARRDVKWAAALKGLEPATLPRGKVAFADDLGRGDLPARMPSELPKHTILGLLDAQGMLVTLALAPGERTPDGIGVLAPAGSDLGRVTLVRAGSIRVAPEGKELD